MADAVRSASVSDYPSVKSLIRPCDACDDISLGLLHTPLRHGFAGVLRSQKADKRFAQAMVPNDQTRAAIIEYLFSTSVRCSYRRRPARHRFEVRDPEALVPA